jgi:hypothetical protein
MNWYKQAQFNTDLKGNEQRPQEEIIVKCPFCNEEGFDLEGLKSHLTNGDCEKFNITNNINRLF